MHITSPLPYAALVAFAALGANLLGTGLLLLINPGSRALRWHAAMSVWIMAWLALQGWFALGRGDDALLYVYGWVVHLMPTFFVAAALVETKKLPDRYALVIVAAGIATAHLLNPVTAGRLGVLWQAALWGAGALLHYRHRAEPGLDAPAAGERVLKFTLVVVVPVAVMGVITLRGAFLLYAMPLITILIQFLIFVGVVHHRFYDIEVRATRSGDLAARAAEQERLALLGELSATLAHEIRNPLTGMRSLAQRLTGDEVEPGRRARYAGVILAEIERLERIVSNLLDVSRRNVVRSGQAESTALDPLFDDVALLLDGRARRAGVAIERDAGGLVVAAPRDALAQSLLNLGINALAHTPPGGSVRLQAVRLPDDRVEVSVSDDGPGVPEEARDRIFEPFHTRGLGVGLGLAVVRRLARELGWELGVRDANGTADPYHPSAASDATADTGNDALARATTGVGACFHIRIPATQ